MRERGHASSPIVNRERWTFTTLNDITFCANCHQSLTASFTNDIHSEELIRGTYCMFSYHRHAKCKPRWNKRSEDTQTLRAGCSKVEPKIFAPPQTPFPAAWDGQNLISRRWPLPLPTNLVRWGSMHTISSYRGNRPTHPHTHKHTNTHTHPPTDRTDYNTRHHS